MSNQPTSPQAPTTALRFLLRAPLLFYRLGLGWLMGRRFLLLNHVGRVSGLPRQTVLEVVDSQPEAGVYLVASGWGRQSDWYRNVILQPKVTIQVGRGKLLASAEPLSAEASGEALARYALRYPIAARLLPRLLGIKSDGSQAAFRQLGQTIMPCVRFRPRAE